MKSTNLHRALAAALTCVALTSIAADSEAGGDETRATAAEPRRGSPLTLHLEDPSGNAFRLIHAEGAGWKYADGWKSIERSQGFSLRPTMFRSSAPAVKSMPADDEPLTVFIDGPSGLTYVWSRDAGWKFVGTLADAGR